MEYISLAVMKLVIFRSSKIDNTFKVPEISKLPGILLYLSNSGLRGVWFINM